MERKVERDLSRVKARDDNGHEIQEGYYKNQDEVDAAFAKRFAHERAKWEREQLVKQSEWERTRTSDEDGGKISSADEQAFYGEGDENSDDYTADEETQAWIDDIAGQAEIIAEYAPDFDVVDELDNNPLFGIMLAEGEALEKVYGYFYPEYNEQRMIDEVERHISDRIRSRSAMPAHMSYSVGQAGMDVKRLSDAQIREIDKRVRGGERIRF